MAERYAQQVIDDVTRGMPQTVVTLSYAAAIIAAAKALEDADWPEVNRTIIDRWSLGALDRIKHAAWKRVNAESRSGEASDG
jgi:hypothetical protein